MIQWEIYFLESKNMTTKVEIEKQFAATQRQLQNTLYTMNVLSDEVDRSKIALEQVKDLSESTKTYKTIGRVFVRVPQPTCSKNLSANIEFCSQELDKHAQLRKEYIV